MKKLTINEDTKNRIYKHFKGDYYYVLAIAYHTETGERMVVYTDLCNTKTYVRPYEMFLEETDFKKYPEAKQPFRFMSISEIADKNIGNDIIASEREIIMGDENDDR